MMIHGFVVIVIAALFYGEASAEWVRVGGTHKYDGYVDMATIGQTEQTVTLWTLKIGRAHV